MSADLDCRVKDEIRRGRLDDVDFGHHCDTGNGSSGSVVFSRHPDCLHIVGLHHWGIINYAADAQNQAVHGTRIKAFLHEKKDNGSADEKIAAEKILSAMKFEDCPA